MSADITHLRTRYAKARAEHKDIGIHYERLRAARHEQLNLEILAREADIMRETRDGLSLLARTLKTLGETFAFGETR